MGKVRCILWSREQVAGVEKDRFWWTKRREWSGVGWGGVEEEEREERRRRHFRDAQKFYNIFFSSYPRGLYLWHLVNKKMTAWFTVIMDAFHLLLIWIDGFVQLVLTCSQMLEHRLLIRGLSAYSERFLRDSLPYKLKMCRRPFIYVFIYLSYEYGHPFLVIWSGCIETNKKQF